MLVDLYMVHVPVKCRYDVSESWSVGVRIASLSTSKKGSHCFNCCTHLQLSKELNAWQLTLTISISNTLLDCRNVHGMDLMIVWPLLCMIQTYSNPSQSKPCTIYTLLHSTMRGCRTCSYSWKSTSWACSRLEPIIQGWTSQSSSYIAIGVVYYH